MGYYINHTADGKKLPQTGKAAFILANIEGSKIIPRPEKFEADLVCIVENEKNAWSKQFDAAGYAFSALEMNHFLRPDSGKQRPRTWMIVPGAKDLAKEF